MRSINIHEAKTHLSRLVEEAARGDGFIIAKAGKPMVRVVSLEKPVVDVSKRLGFLKGSGFAEAWDSLDHDALDKDIEEQFLASRLFPEADETPKT